MAEDLLIRASGVDMSYRRGPDTIQILKGLNLEVEKGAFISLMGPSGSGKTTLLNLLGGLDRPAAGQIEVAGTRLATLTNSQRANWRARHVGYIFQLYNLLPVFTAERNVELPLLLTSLSKARRREQVAVALTLVGLAQRAKHYPSQLSGGEEQRVAIARALVADPTILLCDEPTGDLDQKTGDEILDLLSELNREHGKTIFLVTHDSRAAARASRRLRLHQGQLVEEG